ncbi:MAG: M55 family metallopeptidase [Thermotogota bacterium]|nr:M55 family metallopeptidase [Thermotogota bacterium]
MKIFISTDMEGVLGVASWSEMSKDPTYNRWLNQELSWIIDEIKKSPINSSVEEITICDSHSRGENMPYAELSDPRITYIRGYPRPFYMMQGLDASYDAVFLIGYHTRIGSFRGGMDHSYSASCIYNIKLNGSSVGEMEVNAFYSGLYNVPVVLISGDDVFETQVKQFYFNDFPFVKTKMGIGRFSAKMYHPQLVEKEYRKKTQFALKKLQEKNFFPIKKPEPKTVLEVDVVNTVIADALSVVPGLERIDGRTLKYSSTNYSNIFQMILTIAMLGGRFSDYY